MNNNLYIGVHINKGSKSLLDIIKTVNLNGGNVLQLFAGNPRSCSLSNIDNYKLIAEEVKDYCYTNNFKLVIHTPYTINMASVLKNNKRIIELEEAYWVKLLINQLIISDIIGSIGIVVHVGKYTTNTYENGINNMYNCIIYIISQMKKYNISSKLIIETPAGAGTELLCDINEFINFYNKFTKEEKKYLGICLDTAHIWSSGYNISDYYDIIEKKNKSDIIIIHLNNSKKEKGSKKDLHDNIFDGKMVLSDIQIFVQKLKTNPIIVLECPSDNFKKDISWVKKINTIL